MAEGINELEVAGQLLQSETAEIGAMNVPAAKKAELLDKSYQKYGNSLRNHGVTKATIDAYGALITRMPEQAELLVKALTEMTKEQMKEVLSLQRKQADLAMAKSDSLASATTGIASFATIIATVARYLGYDDFAETIEAKTKDIMSNVKISLNTDNVGSNMDRSLNTLGTNMFATMKSNAKSMTAVAENVTNNDTTKFKTVIGPYVSGAANAPDSAISKEKDEVSWSNIEERLKKDGVTDADKKKVQVLFANAAGDNATIDTQKESINLIKAIKAEASLNKYAPAIEAVIERGMHITGNT